MIKVLSPKEVDLDYLKRMETLLLENQFITYPDYEYKDEYFMMWVNNIRNNSTYKMIILEDDNKIKGFLNYCVEAGENWITEIQVNDKYKNTGITIQLLKKYCELNEDIKEVVAHINPKNELSKNVFVNHVGFKSIDGYKNRYKVSMDDLKNYIKNKEK